MKILRDHQFLSGFLYEEPLASLPAVTHCGEALCARGHAVSPHQHRGFELLYLSRGATTWKICGQSVRQQMGELFIAAPGERHGTAHRATEETHQLWIGLELESLGAEGRQIARLLLKKKVRLLPGCQAMEPILRAIVGQIAQNLPREKRVITAYLRTIFALLEQQSCLTQQPKATIQRQSLPYSYAVQKALAYMEKNLHRRISLSELAAVATVRQTTRFCTQFRAEVGTTPAAHHLQLRLNAARDALRQPAFDITMAAFQFGFSSSQHFSTLFKRVFGMPPRRWLKTSVRKKRYNDRPR